MTGSPFVVHPSHVLFLAGNRQKLLQQTNRKKYFLEVDLDHLASFDDSLADELRNQPEHHLGLVSPHP